VGGKLRLIHPNLFSQRKKAQDNPEIQPDWTGKQTREGVKRPPATNEDEESPLERNLTGCLDGFIGEKEKPRYLAFLNDEGCQYPTTEIR